MTLRHVVNPTFPGDRGGPGATGASPVSRGKSVRAARVGIDAVFLELAIKRRAADAEGVVRPRSLPLVVVDREADHVELDFREGPDIAAVVQGPHRHDILSDRFLCAPVSLGNGRGLRFEGERGGIDAIDLCPICGNSAVSAGRRRKARPP